MAAQRFAPEKVNEYKARFSFATMQSIDKDQAAKQLFEVIIALASDTGQIQQRLAQACAAIQAIDLTFLPESIRARLEEICRQLKRLYPDVKYWHEVEQERAVNLAMEIVVLYDDLTRKDELLPSV